MTFYNQWLSIRSKHHCCGHCVFLLLSGLSEVKERQCCSVPGAGNCANRDVHMWMTGHSLSERCCFPNNLFCPLKISKSNFKPYNSAPQMKLKQFYNGAEPHTPLKFTALESYCAILVLLDMHTHPNPSPKHVYVCVFAFFSQLMFSRMSVSNNKEIILTEARGCWDWKGHVLHSQIMETLPLNRCSPGGRPRRVQCFTSQYDKGIK